MKIRIERQDDAFHLRAFNAGGNHVDTDANPDIGGSNKGMRPMELLLSSLGTCSSIDVIHILRKARQSVTDCVVELDADRAPEDPKVFTAIRMKFIVTGKGLNPVQVERAVKLSKEKYCSASIMLAHSAALSTEIEIREA